MVLAFRHQSNRRNPTEDQARKVGEHRKLVAWRNDGTVLPELCGRVLRGVPKSQDHPWDQVLTMGPRVLFT